MLKMTGVTDRLQGYIWPLIILGLAIVIGVLIPLQNQLTWVFLAGLGFIVGIIIIGQYKRLPFYLLVFLLPYDSVIKISNMPNPVLLLLGAFALIALVFEMVSTQKTKIEFGGAIGGWVAVFAVVVVWLTIFHAGFPGLLNEGRSYIFVFILFWLAINIDWNEKTFDQISWVFVLSMGLLSMIIVLEQGIFIFESGSLDPGRLHSNANGNLFVRTSAQNLTIWIAKGIPFAVHLRNTGKNKSRRNQLNWYMILMVLGILMTVSITGLFNLVLTIGLIAYLAQREKRKVNITSFLVTLIVLVILVGTPFMERLEKISDVVVSGDLLDFATSRGLAWFVSARIFLSNFWTGVGPGRYNFYAETLGYLSESFLKMRERSGSELGIEAHNSYLAIAAEFGVVGIIVFIMTNLVLLIRLSRVLFNKFYAKNKYMISVAGAIWVNIVVYLLVAIGNDIHLEKTYWVLVGMATIVCVSRNLDKKISTRDHQAKVNTESEVEVNA